MNYLLLAVELAGFIKLIILFAVLVLLLNLATKASGRVIGIVLGAVVLSIVIWGFIHDNLQSDVEPAVETSLTAISAVPSSAEPNISNQELWDKLTQTRIDLGEEKTTDNKNEEKEQASEADKAENKPEQLNKPPKPDWLENPPKRMGNLYRQVVSSEPFYSVKECDQQLEILLLEAVRERLQTLASDGVSQSVLLPDLNSFGISQSYISREICKDEFTETVSFSLGEMKRVHVLMEFSPVVEDHLLATWKQHERRHRLGVVGKFAALALSLLASVYGLLQFDTWTRGYYTRRLLVGVPVVIIMAVVLLFG